MAWSNRLDLPFGPLEPLRYRVYTTPYGSGVYDFLIITASSYNFY